MSFGFDTQAPATEDKDETYTGETADYARADTQDEVEETEESDTDEDDTDDSHDESEGASAGAKSTRRATRSALTRANVRKVLAKADQVTAASPAARTIAASALSTSEDTADLTVAILTAGRGAGSAITDVVELAAAEDIVDAIVEVASKPKERVRAIHTLLRELSPTVPASLPPAETKAAAVLAKAAANLEDTDIAALTEVSDLLRRN